jgi:2-oxo-4-hydroxy-4-carboxy-5-ureidoimidazoline decarboxylase
MTIAEINSCDDHRFVETLGWIFESSPWVAERARIHRPFVGVDELHAIMAAEVLAATRAEQLALLNAHPDLGTRARMSDASVGEQAGAGLDRLTPDQFDRLQRLTSAYRAKFGFPFLLAVKGRSADDILDSLEQRLAQSPADEWTEALAQVSRIAGWRLHDLVE